LDPQPDHCGRHGAHRHLLNKRGSLSPREVEIGILVIARIGMPTTSVKLTSARANVSGLSQETIDALVAGTDPKLTDPHERGVYEFANALANGAKLPDAKFADVEKVLGRNGIAEVLVLLGYYTSVALAMKIHEVPIPPQQA
jgi:4-carboxymuconolactone decarboxylase